MSNSQTTEIKVLIFKEKVKSFYIIKVNGPWSRLNYFGLTAYENNPTVTKLFNRYSGTQKCFWCQLQQDNDKSMHQKRKRIPNVK